MSPTKTKWLRSWSVESDDDINHIENISSSPTSLMVSPFRFFDDEIYNTKPYLPSTVSSFQTIIDEAIIDETSTETFYPLIVSPLQTLDDKAYNITSPSTLEVGPLQTVDDENHNPKTPSPTLDVPPLPTIDGETHKTEPPLPTPEITLLQTVDNNINNTPPPPLMVSSLLAIVPYEANKDSIASDDGPSSGAIKRKRGRPKGSKNLKMAIKKPKPYDPNSKVVTSCPSFDSGISEAERETGNKEVAESVLMRFDAVRRRLCQLKCVKGPSLLTTALSNCKNLGVRTNTKKRIGSIPGIKVGEIFYFWGEMCLVGLHMPMVAGIDYLTIKDGATEGPLATSVIPGQLKENRGTDNSRKGLILKDLSYGAENLPIPLVNEIDENDKEMPQDFSYAKSSLVQPMVYECGDACPCPPDCHNRVTQTGTFICELVGMAKRIHGVDEDDEYMFDSSRVYNQFKWNYEPELVGENCWDQVSEAYKLRWRMLVSSKEYGNVSRFMNHSCSPNVMWQPIEFEDSRQPCVRIAFFAMKHIPPLTELRFDYGMSCKTEEVGEDGKTIFKGKKICHCGSFKCQGSFG
ncbi:hypothetical protein Bca52824_015158 [Brassica carinata]|uniref:SET domain-containing protein n=1 Tax=Brassica carinata TaxID=52824 RepID=A0A8X7W467_BRACI|nr:hypothetical protein Bca52824_015158 [Brassica carinata]